jgi:formylglycine-generating enzyme required for sulfatase activity
MYSMTQSSSYPSSQNYLTDVGAFTNSASYYGTFDPSGNVYQWNDLDGTAGSSRGLRGGRWYSNVGFLSSFDRDADDPSLEVNSIGFRLASPVSGPFGVPEIDVLGARLALVLLASGLALLERRRSGR